MNGSGAVMGCVPAAKVRGRIPISKNCAHFVFDVPSLPFHLRPRIPSTANGCTTQPKFFGFDVVDAEQCMRGRWLPRFRFLNHPRLVASRANFQRLSGVPRARVGCVIEASSGTGRLRSPAKFFRLRFCVPDGVNDVETALRHRHRRFRKDGVAVTAAETVRACFPVAKVRVRSHVHRGGRNRCLLASCRQA